MSHFTVAVITADGNYEQALAPFDENIKVEPYIQETRESIIQRLKERKLDVDSGQSDSFIQEDLANVDWNNDDSILKAYMDYWKDGEQFDKNGNLLTTYNPQAKWDWYSLGGRWCGSLKLKHPVDYTKQSEPSLLQLMDDTKTVIDTLSDELLTDHAQVKDIDFSPNLKDVEFHKRFWEINVLEYPLKEGEDAKTYDSFYNKKYYLENYGDMDTYIKCNTEFFTYALLYHGQWLEPGTMGWFGCSNANKESYAQYRQKFFEIINNLNPEDWISVVDCHI